MSYQQQIPTVTLHDLQEFNARHFLHRNNNGTVHPLIPVTDAEQLDDGGDDDDDLGYYPDGTKRTLTDQQIEIFRHSEIQKLQREKRWKEMADQEQAEDEALTTDASKDPLAGAGRSEAKGGGQGSSEYQQHGMEATEKSYHDIDRKSTEENMIRDGNGNGGAEKPLACADQGTTFGHSQKPVSSSATNPFGRRLVSYDD
ncbi:hypothetical protein EMPG_16825 [Blastomyces silverae]|uniref:Uncharacterized protein n=1 Tax=Blastomyces silverae TaxID=2060906 RepID=A0A0H1BEQ0_9EURO|nr:hypothetical protein EMPG_16825 [Blastomyces silverae]